MNIDSIRVRVGKQYHNVYRDLTQDTVTRPKVFQQHGDVFTLCTVLGHRLGRRNECRGADLFWSHSLNKHQQIVLMALAVAEAGDYGTLSTPASVVETCEGYAEAGMEYLLDGVLAPFAHHDEKGGYSLHVTDSDEVEKLMSSAIADLATTGPIL